MLTLKRNEVCPYANKCPHNKNHECWGAEPTRFVEYKCSFVENGKILENKFRNPLDKTGQMKVIME